MSSADEIYKYLSMTKIFGIWITEICFHGAFEKNNAESTGVDLEPNRSLGICGNDKCAIFKYEIMIKILSIAIEIDLRPMLHDVTDNITLVQVTAWCRQISRYCIDYAHTKCRRYVYAFSTRIELSGRAYRY